MDYLAETGGVVVVEWADRLRDLLPDTILWITLEHRSEGGRRAVIAAPAGSAFAWLADLRPGSRVGDRHGTPG